jgi:hypothetical protein
VERVETTDPDGVDFGWVMQTTFVLTVTFGAVVVAALSAGRPLPTWADKATFAVRVGAVVWLLTAVPVYLYARRRVDDPPDRADRADETDGEDGDAPDTGSSSTTVEEPQETVPSPSESDPPGHSET